MLQLVDFERFLDRVISPGRKTQQPRELAPSQPFPSERDDPLQMIFARTSICGS